MAVVNQIAPSTIASALAVGQQYADLRTGAPVLQQRVFVIAQGRSSVSQPVQKFTAESSGEVGEKCGYGSPIHLMARKLFPPDGNGLSRGAVEATFFALSDASGSVAAQKTIDSVGTQTKAADKIVRIADFRAPFSLAKDATGDTVLNAIKDAIEADPSAPVTVVLEAGSATAGYMYTGAVSASLAAFQAVIDGSFKLSVDGGAALEYDTLSFAAATDMDDVAAVIDTAVTALATCVWDSANSRFLFTSKTTGETSAVSVLTAGGVGTDISGSDFLNGLEGAATTVPGTDADNILTLTAKWKGDTSSEILDVEITEEEDTGVTFVLEDKTSGAGDPSIQPGIDAMGTSIWYTAICQQFSTTTALDIVQTKGDSEYQPLVHQPLFALVGENVEADAVTLGASRKTDKINAVACAYGCPAMTFEIGARTIAEVLSRANTEPNRHYTGLILSGLTPGDDSLEPGLTGKDGNLKDGVSTTAQKDGVIKIEDIVTFYRPDGELPDPGYRWLVDVVKLQNIVNSLVVKFSGPDWEAMTILDDNDVSSNPNVRRVSDVKAAIHGLADSWVDLAWCTDVEYTKKNLFVAKAVGVRNRFESIIPVKISDSLRQQDHLVRFGFNFG